MKINLNCPIGKTGYGITSLNILKALDRLGIDVSLFPIGGSNVELNSESEKEILQRVFNNSKEFDRDAPCLKIWHQFDLAQRIGSGKYFAFPFFEVDTLKPLEKVHLNSTDHIFVASKWAKEILEKNDIVKPISVAPLAVDGDIFSLPTKIRMQNDNYVFFHIGKWEYRKAQDFIVKAFSQAFTKEDNVELWMMCDNPFLSKNETQNYIDMCASSPIAHKIKVYERVPTQYHLANFIHHADCGLFPSRAEGWNNSILESMSLSKPIITTNYSAHTEYCTAENSYLVDIDELEVANDARWFFGEGNWAKLGKNQLDQMVNHLQTVYNKGIRTNPAGLETAAKFTWEKTALNIIEAIGE